jgi:hypothetical protein
MIDLSGRLASGDTLYGTFFGLGCGRGMAATVSNNERTAMQLHTDGGACR